MLHMLDIKQVKSSLIDIPSIRPKDCTSTLEECKLNDECFLAKLLSCLFSAVLLSILTMPCLKKR